MLWECRTKHFLYVDLIHTKHVKKKEQKRYSFIENAIGNLKYIKLRRQIPLRMSAYIKHRAIWIMAANLQKALSNNVVTKEKVTE